MTLPAYVTRWWRTTPLRLTLAGGVVCCTFSITRLDSVWTGDNGNAVTADGIPAGMRPMRSLWAYLEPRFGLYLNVTPNGGLASAAT